MGRRTFLGLGSFSEDVSGGLSLRVPRPCGDGTRGEVAGVSEVTTRPVTTRRRLRDFAEL
eukprot:1824064-Pyramimonas_sp.AAC.1